jgi:glycerol-3-phosphate dehydrogenase
MTNCCSCAPTIPASSVTACDVLVIGGAGVARDAALRGLKVILHEKGDFASGTSGSSSRLLHGGLRYLGQGRIGLVWEASTEKVTLGEIAPHLAQPLPFLFPSYSGSDWPRWKLTIGVKVYDLLCSGKNFGKSQSMNRAQMLEAAPGLTPEGLNGGVRYFDGFTQDARLVLDTLRSAVIAGAAVHNYSEAMITDTSATATATATATGLWEVRHRCRQCNRESTSITRSVINAAGPWATKFGHSEIKLRLTKGVHLVVPADRLPVSAAMVMPEGNRILFAIPWGERTIIGTTDTDFSGNRDKVRCTTEDRDYLLEIVNRYFPSAHLCAADVRSTWAGLRPLIAPSGTVEANAPSDISRSHKILMPQPGWFDVAGGKLTTYRIIGEQAIDRAMEHLQRAGQATHQRHSKTAHQPLLPDSGDVSRINGISAVLPPRVSREAVEHFCQHEWARHLADIMVRRTSWVHYLDDHRGIARQVAQWMAACLHWSPERTADEVADYEKLADALESLSPDA